MAAFAIGDRVKRDPKVWRGDKTVFTVRGFATSFDNKPLILIAKEGVTREADFFTGKMLPVKGVGYEARELRAI